MLCRFPVYTDRHMIALRTFLGWRGIAIAGLIVAQAAFAGGDDGRLDFYWIDVEGGAATLLVTPSGESILIDTGMPGLRDPVRINRLARRIAGLERIDHLVITHFDKDHYGGAADVSRLIPVGVVYDHGVRPQDRERVGDDYLTFECERRLVLTPGDALPLAQAAAGLEVRIDCLAALQRFIDPRTEHAENPRPRDATLRDPDLSHNANSIVLLIRFGDFELLDAADLTWNLEEKLVCPRNLVGKVDVYQTDHHGLDQSNNPVLIKSIEPRVAIMNNGHRKGCGPLTFATLQDTPSIDAIYQVHKNLRPDGSENNAPDAFIANQKEGDLCEGNHIELSVAPDGKSYTVRVPSTGHEATYECK